MARGRGKKDPWEDLAPEFKAKAEAADDAALNDLIKEAALKNEWLAEAEALDDHLAECRAAASDAAKQYRDGRKQNKLEIAFCRALKKSRGVAVPGDGK